MSQENVEVARRSISDFNRRDIAAFLEPIDPNVEWIPLGAALEGRVYRGHEGVRQWFEDLAADWEVFEISVEEIRDLGNRVLSLGHWRAKGRGSGVPLEDQPSAWLSEFKDGKCVRFQTYSDRAEALEAVGLSE